MIQQKTKGFSIWRPVKLENRLSAPSIQWWNRHRIKTTCIPFQNGRIGRKKKKESLMPSYFKSQLDFLSESLPIILCGSALWFILPFTWQAGQFFRCVVYEPFIAFRVVEVKEISFIFVFSLHLLFQAGSISAGMKFSIILWIFCMYH